MQVLNIGGYYRVICSLILAHFCRQQSVADPVCVGPGSVTGDVSLHICVVDGVLGPGEPSRTRRRKVILTLACLQFINSMFASVCWEIVFFPAKFFCRIDIQTSVLQCGAKFTL